MIMVTEQKKLKITGNDISVKEVVLREDNVYFHFDPCN